MTYPEISFWLGEEIGTEIKELLNLAGLHMNCAIPKNNLLSIHVYTPYSTQVDWTVFVTQRPLNIYKVRDSINRVIIEYYQTEVDFSQ